MIPVTCSCGKVIQVKDEHAGRRIKCPACKAAVDVPAPASIPTPVILSQHGFNWGLTDFSLSRVLLALIAVLSGLPAATGLIDVLRGTATPLDQWPMNCLIFTVALAGLAASRSRR